MTVTGKFDREIVGLKSHFSQRAVWRNGGSSPAEKAVQIWNIVSRRKFSGSRHYAKPLGRCTQAGRQCVTKRQRFEKKV